MGQAPPQMTTSYSYQLAGHSHHCMHKNDNRLEILEILGTSFLPTVACVINQMILTGVE